LVGCVALLLVPGLSAGISLLFYLAPLLGAGLYFVAKKLRQKIVYAIANGAKGKNDVVSAHYYRFHLMLDLFFLFALIGGCFLLLGNYTNLLASGIIGAFASVLTTASILLTCSIALILLVLLMFYIFRWRKDPSGYAPKRERHPRKDG
jgi:Na+/H+ antiporter NhaD/arsenite permease-like protein